MPNPVHTITKVFKDHFTCDDKDVYIQTLRLIDHVATELDQYDYETNGDGQKILQELIEDVDEYEKSQREDEDKEDEIDEDETPARITDDLDDDEPISTEEKVT